MHESASEQLTKKVVELFHCEKFDIEVFQEKLKSVQWSSKLVGIRALRILDKQAFIKKRLELMKKICT